LRFYDREKEKKTIISFARKTDRARIVVLTGRRRIGKTRLLLELFGEKAFHLLWKELPSFEGKKPENLNSNLHYGNIYYYNGEFCQGFGSGE